MGRDDDHEHERLFTLSEANHLIPQLNSRMASVLQAKAVLARTKDDIRRARMSISVFVTFLTFATAAWFFFVGNTGKRKSNGGMKPQPATKTVAPSKAPCSFHEIRHHWI